MALEAQRLGRHSQIEYYEPAERLYKRAGFRFVAAKEMFYEDTGWMEFRMFEFPL